ncbi:MAG: hypothetical protein ACREIV_00730 [Planctomycetaceae bacterium]
MNDATDAVQDALDELTRGYAVPPLGAGYYRITKPLTLGPCMGARLAGSGNYARSLEGSWPAGMPCTVLEYDGPPEHPALTCTGTAALAIERLTIVRKNNDAPAIRIRDGWGSLNITFRQVAIHGGSAGIEFGTEPTESTCANVTYDDVFWKGCTSCVRLNNLQSLEHLFLRPQFNFAQVGVEVRRGGNVTILGGGSYQLGTLLELHRIASNTRGFNVTGFRCDGPRTRTAWLHCVEPERTRTLGAVSYNNCAQNNGQKESRLPLLTICSGARAVLRECNLNAYPDNLEGGNLAHLHSNARAAAELIVENCDGIRGDRLDRYLKLHGPRATALISRCGNLYTRSGYLAATTITEHGLINDILNERIPTCAPETEPEQPTCSSPESH